MPPLRAFTTCRKGKMVPHKTTIKMSCSYLCWEIPMDVHVLTDICDYDN